MELVATREGAACGERRVGGRHRLPVAQGEARCHGRRHLGQHPAHRLAVQRAAQVEQSGALGDHRSAGGRERADLGPQRGVGGERAGVHLREPAADDQRRRPVGQRLVGRRVEAHDLGAGGREQLGRLRVAERERRPARHRDHRAPPTSPGRARRRRHEAARGLGGIGCLGGARGPCRIGEADLGGLLGGLLGVPGIGREVGRGRGEREQRVEVEAGADRVAELGHGRAGGRRALGGRDQTEVA